MIDDWVCDAGIRTTFYKRIIVFHLFAVSLQSNLSAHHPMVTQCFFLNTSCGYVLQHKTHFDLNLIDDAFNMCYKTLPENHTWTKQKTSVNISVHRNQYTIRMFILDASAEPSNTYGQYNDKNFLELGTEASCE